MIIAHFLLWHAMIKVNFKRFFSILKSEKSSESPEDNAIVKNK